MTKIILILLVAFAFEAFGIIALKKGLGEIKAQYAAREGAGSKWKNILAMVGDWFTNKDILLGLLLETIFFVLLQYLLAQQDVSFVWPLTAVSFIMTTLAARFILHEPVNAIRWTGVIVIVLGAAIISYGEHQKEKIEPTAAQADAGPK